MTQLSTSTLKKLFQAKFKYDFDNDDENHFLKLLISSESFHKILTFSIEFLPILQARFFANEIFILRVRPPENLPPSISSTKKRPVRKYKSMYLILEFCSVSWFRTVSLQIFYRLSFTNFAWSTIEYFVPILPFVSVFSSILKPFPSRAFQKIVLKYKLT